MIKGGAFVYAKSLATGVVFPVLYVETHNQLTHGRQQYLLLGSKDCLSPAWTKLSCIQSVQRRFQTYRREGYNPSTGENDEGYLYGIWIAPFPDSLFWKVMGSISSNIDALSLIEGS
jgi:hypothetical protein